MKRCLCVMLLCLLLAGCAPKAPSEPLPTASPTPTASTPAPSAEPSQDPEDILLAQVDEVLAEKEIYIRFWQHPGSGPSSETLPTAEFGEAVRGLFTELDWEITESPTYDEEAAEDAPFNQPGAYSVDICYSDSRPVAIQMRTGKPVVMLVNSGPDNMYLRADGAEELCDKLADLTPSFYINLGRTRVPPQESLEATLKLYLETAMERLKANGHITDYDLRSYEILPIEEGIQPREEEYPSIAYVVTYAIKPAHPELTYWQDCTFDADGWVSVDWEGEWEVLAYDERDGCYGMA